jgi:hypothetical protein
MRGRESVHLRDVARVGVIPLLSLFPEGSRTVNAIHPSLSGAVMRAHEYAPDPRLLAALPLRDSVEFGAVEIAPGFARRRSATILAEWDLADLEYPAGLIISELTTNSVQATRAHAWAAGMPPVRLWLLASRAAGVYILVHDAVPHGPEPRRAAEVDDLDESGRGLSMILPDFSADCGWYQSQDRPGKVTWALVTSPG